MTTIEQTYKAGSSDRSSGFADKSSPDSSSAEKSRAISREQRSEAAKRGWVTRKKRKP